MNSGRVCRPYSYALTAAIVCALSPLVHAGRALFDATKNEIAGNADWVIDSDAELSGNSNPQRIPTPAQSGITATTPETYWKGGISAWGVTMVQHGNTVESLPRTGGRITYGDATNAQDLSHYKTYVVCEPNNLFTLAEKTAIVNFVAGGGGLYLVSDHDNADRDGDGVDAVDAWNDLFTNNGVASNPFGMAVNNNSFSQVSTNVNASGPFKTGAAGTATNLEFNSGASFTISPSANSSVAAAVWTNGSQTNSNVMMAYATYGLGRVVALGDSSPADDGTGDTGDTLYDGWPTGTNGVLIANGTDWLGASLQSTYDAAGGGSFATAASWTGLVPDSTQAVVDFKNGIAADSTVTLDRARSVATLRFDSKFNYMLAGSSAITLGGSPVMSGLPTGISVISGSPTIAVPLIATSRATFNVQLATSTLTIGTLTEQVSGSGISKTGLGTLNVARIEGRPIFNVSAGLVRFTAASTAAASAVSVVTITTGASVDLGTSSLVLDYGSTSQLSTIKTYLVDGRLKTTATGLTVGYGEAGALGVTSFGGIAVAPTALVVRSTYAGDANLDLTVNFDDLIALAQHYNAAGVWTDGDFNYSGNVNFDDLILLAQHYNATVLPNLSGLDTSCAEDWALAQSLVPEPTSLVLLLPLLAFRRR